MCERIFGILLLLSVCLHASSHYTQGGCLSVRFLVHFVSAELWQREKEGVSISYIIFISDLVKSEDDPEDVLSRTVISLVSCPALQGRRLEVSAFYRIGIGAWGWIGLELGASGEF